MPFQDTSLNATCTAVVERIAAERVAAGRGQAPRERVGAASGRWSAMAVRNLARSSAPPPKPSALADIIKGPLRTFAACDCWLNGWSTPSHD
jgi:hypothetical protein